MNRWINWRGGLLALVLVTPYAGAQEPAKAPTYPHRLTGEELEAHFKGDWTVDATTSRASVVTLYNYSNGTLRVQQRASTITTLGTRTVKAGEERVCLDFGTSTWRGATDCYRVVQTEPNAYSMRSMSNNFRLDYRR